MTEVHSWEFGVWDRTLKEVEEMLRRPYADRRAAADAIAGVRDSLKRTWEGEDE